MTNPLRGKLTHDASLKKLNSWRVGGAAKQLYKPVDLDDLQRFMPTLEASDNPIWLGLGSNVLIPDAGLDCTVILTLGGLKAMTLLEDNVFRLEAGVTCAKAAKFCVQHDFIDGEFFAGIPGTIGGALRMNAGAFGGETWPHVLAVETIDRQGVVRMRTPNEYAISYRTVAGPGLSEGEPEWFVAGHFQLPKGDGQVTQQNIKQLLKKRNASQPIGVPSCGSVFKNPPGDYAARLIEASGLKGHELGGAQISPKHANFIVNTGDASAQDLLALIQLAQQEVWAQQQVQLVPEVEFLGWPAEVSLKLQEFNQH
jgi:UDP-N-acetylmuramate dehydrogenase